MSGVLIHVAQPQQFNMTVKNGDVSILEGESELNSEEMFLKFFILQNSELHTFNTTQVLYLED